MDIIVATIILIAIVVAVTVFTVIIDAFDCMISVIFNVLFNGCGGMGCITGTCF